LILLCSAQFIVVLDASIVNVALPSIGKGSISRRKLPWIVNAYVIASAASCCSAAARLTCSADGGSS